MTKKAASNVHDELRPEYRIEDFAGAKLVRGKYYRRYLKGAIVVRIAPDVNAAFPNEQAVNDALRTLIRIARSAVKPSARNRSRGRLSKRSAAVRPRE